MFNLNILKHKIIFVHISGGLGNQLFQIANAIDLVAGPDLKNFSLIFLYTGNPKIKKNHEYERLSSLGFKSLCISSALSKWIIRFFKALGIVRIANVKIETEDKNDILKPGINFIEGLYQRIPSRTSIRFLNSKIRLKCSKAEYSVLHIRLGDYLSKESMESVGVISDKFYKNCLETLNKYEYPIWIVSDGTKDQVNQILKNSEISYQIKNPEADMKDLEFIANAKIVAICNSTFSLWACYLKEKTVVYYPSTWFPARQKDNRKNLRIKRNWLALK